MHAVEPKVFLIGETRIIEEGLQECLEHLGASDWKTDACTDSERVVEVMGRLCYRSFKPGLNPNVTKVREGNDIYLANILKVKHDSVMEHPVMNFVFADVSRVFGSSSHWRSNIAGEPAIRSLGRLRAMAANSHPRR